MPKFCVDNSSRPLSTDDIVKIKALIPESVNFDYVDEGNLTVNLENIAAVTGNKRREDIFDLLPKPNSSASLVLHFEFIDGELRPKKKRKNLLDPPDSRCIRLITIGSKPIDGTLNYLNLHRSQ